VRSDDEMGFPELAAPARRALRAAGYTRLDQLAQVSEADLTKLHDMGTTVITALREALHERGLSLSICTGRPARSTSIGVVSRSRAAARFRPCGARSSRSSRTRNK
jgi:hypothetical protein